MNGMRILSGVRKIAVLRANALGDFIFVLPALGALRQTYPDAEIVYLGTPWHKRFLEGRPGPVDRIIPIPRYHGLPHEQDRIDDIAETESFFLAMQQEAFDIAFQMHGGGKHSNPFVLRLGARVTAGLQAPGAPPLDLNVPYFLPQNEILRYLEVAACAGAAIRDAEPRLCLTEDDRLALCQEWGLPEQPYAVLHPGASDVHRRWSPEKFAKVGDALAGRTLQVLVTGSDNERHLAHRLIAHMKYRAVDLTGKLSLKALAALLAGARLLVSNDTGPLHLARALGTPNVGLFWTINALTAGAISVSHNRLCIAWNPFCPQCGKDCLNENVHEARGTCLHDCSLVEEISTEEVIHHALDLLSFSRRDFSMERVSERLPE